MLKPLSSSVRSWLLVLVGLLGFAQANAQISMSPRRENSAIFKALPLFWLPTPKMVYGIAGEFKAGPAFSIQGDVAIAPSKTTDDLTTSTFAGGVQARFYLNNFDVFDGLYIGGTANFISVKFEKSSNNSRAQYFGTPFGLLIGYQYRATDQLYFDFNFGPQITPGKLTPSVGTVDEFSAKSYDGMGLRGCLGIGWGF